MAQVFEIPTSSTLATAQALSGSDFTRSADGTYAPFPTLSLLGSVSPNNDQDYWSLLLRAGDVVTFDIDATSGLDSQIFLYNPSQAFVQMNDDGGVVDPGSGTTLDPFMTYTVATTGLWYLGLQSYNAATGGNYILHISIQSPNQTLFGSATNDALSGWMGADTVYGYAQGLAAADLGNDTLSGLAGNDLLDGAAGADSLVGGDGVDTLLGGTGGDTLAGGVGADSLDGGADADSLVGGDNADTVFGGDGADTITGNGGADRLEGGDGDDQVWAVAVSDIAGTDADTLLGGGGNDFLFGNDGDNRLNGGTGNDTLLAWNGADTLLGEDGNDSVVGYAGNTRLDGGIGDDILFSNTSSGRTTMIGGDGADTVLGSFGIDSVSGDAGDDSLRGLDGFDTLRGGTGNDVLDGGIGIDYLDGGAGNDTLVGGEALNAVDPFLRETLVGGYGADSIVGNRAPMLAHGGLGADSLTGAERNDMLYGGEGDDVISDAFDNNTDIDLIDGGGGNDTLSGSAYDTILGGEGNDRLNFLALQFSDFGYRDGGAGTDTVVFPTIFPANNFARLTQGTNGVALLETVGVITGVVQRSFEFRNFEGFWLTGSTFDDRMEGGTGADSLNGNFGGNDEIFGHDGNDTLVGLQNNLLLLDGGAGNDDLADSGSYAFTLATLLGGTGNDTITANSRGVADGGEGDDEIGLYTNVDTALQGGSGNDYVKTYFTSGGSGFVVASGGAGDDLLYFVTFLSGPVSVETDGSGGGEILHGDGILVFDGFERLQLEGTAHDDTLRGGLGNDTLYDFAGANLLEASDGDDLIIAGLNDTVDGGAGIDTFWISVQAAPGNFTLAPPAGASGIERYRLTSSAGADSLTGAGDADTLDGWLGADTLDGAGGADSLLGGTGSDLYFVDNIGDTVLELAGAGSGADTVSASATWTLGAGQEVEVIVLSGSANIGATGNEIANTLLGNAGNNRLAGGEGNDTIAGGEGADTLDGGGGADSLVGGGGADLYIVDNLGDVVVEDAVPGSDLVRTSVTFTLPVNVERLELTGSANLRGNGNAGNNIITGNAGANMLQGANGADTINGGEGADTLDGGAGADSLVGGAGADAFRFISSAHGTDIVADFTPGSDAIHVLRTGFGSLLPVGALAPGALTFGTVAAGAGAQFIYDSATGTLRWDADGTGPTAVVVLATLVGAPSLAATDFLVVA